MVKHSMSTLAAPCQHVPRAPTPQARSVIVDMECGVINEMLKVGCVQRKRGGERRLDGMLLQA